MKKIIISKILRKKGYVITKIQGYPRSRKNQKQRKIFMIVPKVKKFIEKKRNKPLWKPVILLKDSLGFFKYDLKKLYILKKKKAVLIWIPKNASNSLKNALVGKVYFQEKRRASPREVVSIPNFNLEKYFVFAFVRNPYDRLVSCYLGKEKFFGESLSNYDMNSNMSFREFVKKVSKIPDEKANMHFKSQVFFLKDDKGKLIPDFIGKLENLEKDFNSLCGILKLNPKSKLPVLNKTKNRKKYQDYYDKETMKLVWERYKEDFRIFKYDSIISNENQ